MTDVPVPFKGSKAAKEKNFLTHNWRAVDDEIVCFDCAAEAHDTAANYPCGAVVPRMTVGEEEADVLQD